MLAASHRLRKSADIGRVYKKGAYGGSGGLLSVKALHTGRSESRAVIVVAKKVSKRAVVRNRIRRRLSGQLALDWAKIRSGYDIVISVHSDISDRPGGELKEALHQALARAGNQLIL